MDSIDDLIAFLSSSPTPYHAVASATARLLAAGLRAARRARSLGVARRRPVLRGARGQRGRRLRRAPGRRRGLSHRRRAHRQPEPAPQAEARVHQRGLPAAWRRGVRRGAAQLVARSRSGARRSGAAARRGRAARDAARAARSPAAARAAAGHPPRSRGQREGPGAEPARAPGARAGAAEQRRGGRRRRSSPRPLGAQPRTRRARRPDAARHPGPGARRRARRAALLGAPGQPRDVPRRHPGDHRAGRERSRSLALRRCWPCSITRRSAARARRAPSRTSCRACSSACAAERSRVRRSRPRPARIAVPVGRHGPRRPPQLRVAPRAAPQAGAQRRAGAQGQRAAALRDERAHRGDRRGAVPGPRRSRCSSTSIAPTCRAAAPSGPSPPRCSACPRPTSATRC